ncbi:MULTISPECIES: hypothetical protein [unclassified Mesorhizobium]|uniref:hypothetical protein n=1 Tax=unclassified Mesorhizobium TaxID=325217 RepID=UPI00241524D3|nr:MULTISPECIES: hypothetical protein [unclassified Mesorhizobium]MDG4853858.1 hypothetical protein [Mesorhizobium sp. WSM4982]MDG4915703.1 hypothetical protein [Mesorhizobium sp. WSM4983]
MITAEVSIYLRVLDTLALANAAARRDPGQSPAGVEILDSACEVQEGRTNG